MRQGSRSPRTFLESDSYRNNFSVGREYSRGEIHTRVGGDLQSMTLTVIGRIVQDRQRTAARAQRSRIFVLDDVEFCYYRKSVVPLRRAQTGYMQQEFSCAVAPGVT
jgi:hypothetical protein